jgi:DHA1 family tetracycline resistance protein-like MFS transporter
MKTKTARVQFVFATLLLDSLGIGILIPIMPDILRRFSTEASFVSHYYGYFISVYALMQFVASPILGSLSDRYGRRPILLCSLLGAGLDYILMAFAPTLSILFLGRIIAGLTGASMTVATAYIADVSDDSNRSSNFGLIGAAFGFGFILGPAIGGVMGTLGHQYPFLLAAGLNLLNFAFGLFVLPESLPKESRRKIQVAKLNPLVSLVKVLKPSPTLIFIWVYILIFLAAQAHPSIWTLFTQTKFNWSPADVGWSLTAVGVSTALVQGGLTRVIIPRLGEWNSVALCIAISALAYFGFAVATQGWMMYAILIPSALAGIGGPAIQSLISKNVPPQEQGELQGSLVSLGSLTAIAGPLIYTGLFSEFTKASSPVYFPGIAYTLAAVICLLAGALLFFTRATTASSKA